jgi:hypothetical protein
MEAFKSNVAELLGQAAAKPATPSLRRFTDLSASRQALVRLCQATNYGQIHHLEIRDGDPVLSPPPLVLIGVKLDADEVARPEVDLPDFELCKEVRRLIVQLHELTTGVIEHIEVRAGIPRRIVFRSLFRLHPPPAGSTWCVRWPLPLNRCTP